MLSGIVGGGQKRWKIKAYLTAGWVENVTWGFRNRLDQLWNYEEQTRPSQVEVSFGWKQLNDTLLSVKNPQ